MLRVSPSTRGIFYFVLYTLTQMVSLAGSKLLMDHYNYGLVTFFRLIVPWTFLWLWLAFRPQLRPWRSTRWRLHLLRGFVGFACLLLLYLAVKLLPLPLAMTIRQVESFFWVGMAALWYGEKADRRQWLALIIGFLGVVLVMRPAMEINMLGAGIALLTAIVGAWVRVLSRDLSRTEDSVTIIFYNFTQWTFLSALALPWTWQPVAEPDWLPIIGIGLLILISQWFMTEGTALVPAAKLAPWRNSEILWSVLLGWMIWHEPVGLWFVAGSALIIIGGIMASWAPARKIESSPLATP